MIDWHMNWNNQCVSASVWCLALIDNNIMMCTNGVIQLTSLLSVYRYRR